MVSTGVRRMPNHVAPSHLRCRAKVRIGSLALSPVARSIVVMTQRSHTIVARNAPRVLGEGLAALDDDVGPEAVVPERLPRMLAALQRRLGHPVVEPAQR